MMKMRSAVGVGFGHPHRTSNVVLENARRDSLAKLLGDSSRNKRTDPAGQGKVTTKGQSSAARLFTLNTFDMLKKLLLCSFALGITNQEFVDSVKSKVYEDFEGSPLLDKVIGQFSEDGSSHIPDPDMNMVDFIARMGAARRYPVGNKIVYIDYSGKPLYYEDIDFERLEYTLKYENEYDPEGTKYKDIQDFKNKSHETLESAIEEAKKYEGIYTEHDILAKVREIKEALTYENHDEL